MGECGFCGIKCADMASYSNKVGMKNETEVRREFTPTEAQFMARLREHPELLARTQTILELTRNPDGRLKTADEVEERLILELRQLGNTSMNQLLFSPADPAAAGVQLAGIRLFQRRPGAKQRCDALGPVILAARFQGTVTL